jgi:hypothetical protein
MPSPKPTRWRTAILAYVVVGLLTLAAWGAAMFLACHPLKAALF